MTPRSLIVSLHDVSPLTRTACQEILDDLAESGVRSVSLLVIPDHHGKAPVRGDKSFSAWAGERVRGGDEAVLHGYLHLRSQPGHSESWSSRFVTNHYTAGEGEFFDIREAVAGELLRRGKDDLATCGLNPCGFIAPAWLLGDEALRAVRTCGFSYTTRLGTIMPLADGAAPHASQSLVWSTRAAWRRMVSLGWNRLLFRTLTANPVLRIGLHPPDWRYPAVKRQILGLIRAALAGRQAITYENWIRHNDR